MTRRFDLAAFYDRSAALAYGLALRITGDAGRAGEVLVRVYAEAQEWDQGPQNMSTTRLLLRVRELALAARSAGSDSAAPPPNAPLRLVASHRDPHTAASIRAALEQLTPLDREVLGLAYFGGQSPRAIGGQLGLPEADVCHRIRAALILVARVRDRTREGAT